MPGLEFGPIINLIDSKYRHIFFTTASNRLQLASKFIGKYFTLSEVDKIFADSVLSGPVFDQLPFKEKKVNRVIVAEKEIDQDSNIGLLKSSAEIVQ